MLSCCHWLSRDAGANAAADQPLLLCLLLSKCGVHQQQQDWLLHPTIMVLLLGLLVLGMLSAVTPGFSHQALEKLVLLPCLALMVRGVPAAG